MGVIVTSRSSVECLEEVHLSMLLGRSWKRGDSRWWAYGPGVTAACGRPRTGSAARFLVFQRRNASQKSVFPSEKSVDKAKKSVHSSRCHSRKHVSPSENSGCLAWGKQVFLSGKRRKIECRPGRALTRSLSLKGLSPPLLRLLAITFRSVH
jgi:hypothetical protein